MTIWPVFLDSEPTSLPGRSLLLIPLGTDTLIGHLRSWVEPITRKAPIVLSADGIGAQRRVALKTACPAALIASTRHEFEEATLACELSDAFLIIDPRCLPFGQAELSSLVRQYSTESRIAHQLVAFETGSSGTKEHVNIDSKGHVRGVHRYYQPATWPFLAGVAATMLPVASGLVGGAWLPASLAELRQVLATRGVPSRDVPIATGALDLSDEPGLLAANEHFIWRAIGTDSADNADRPLRIGAGHVIHHTARIMGPVVIHEGARIGANATVVGPAMIGAGASVDAGSMVVHAIVGPNSTVSPGTVLRDCLWFDDADGRSPTAPPQPMSYRDCVARLNVESRDKGQTQPGRQRHARAKRVFDATLATVALVFLSPLLLAVAIAILIESGWPVFFAHKREGMNGRVFRCWKFRTMSVGADVVQQDLKSLDTMDGPHFKIARDPRVTRVGRFLRATNLDELPQLFNVVVGDMSLIGPRPSPFRENQVCVPWREARLSVRPGITGLWQVCRHDRSAGDFHQWIEYDVLYVRHMSFWLDLKIMVATVATAGGKKSVPSSWLVRTAAPGSRSGFDAIRSRRAVHQTERTAST